MYSIYSLNTILGYYNAKIGREDIFKTTGSEILHEINNNNVVKVVNFTTSKNLIVKRTMFPHRNINIFTRKSREGKTQKHIDHILTDRRRQ
jgi:hypothetical protein